jgi:hypothetical protein
VKSNVLLSPVLLIAASLVLLVIYLGWRVNELQQLHRFTMEAVSNADLSSVLAAEMPDLSSRILPHQT